MEMTINDAILTYNLLSVAKFVDGDYSISRELKIKLIRYKLDLEKVKNEFLTFQEKAMEEVKTEEYVALISKDRNEQEQKRLEEITISLNEELGKLISNKTTELVEVRSFEYLTDDEFNDFLSVNVENEVVINGNTIDPNTYIELFYNNFVKWKNPGR